MGAAAPRGGRDGSQVRRSHGAADVGHACRGPWVVSEGGAVRRGPERCPAAAHTRAAAGYPGRSEAAWRTVLWVVVHVCSRPWVVSGCEGGRGARPGGCPLSRLARLENSKKTLPPLTAYCTHATQPTVPSAMRPQSDRGSPPWRACGRQRGSALGRAGRARGVSRARRTCGSRRGSPQPGSRAAAPAGAQPPPPPRAAAGCCPAHAKKSA